MEELDHTADGLMQLRPGKDVTIRRGHPWVFEGAVSRLEGAPISGDVVEVVDSDGIFIAWAVYSESSQIRARCVSRRKSAYPGEMLLRDRLSRAWDLRQRLGFSPSGGVRVVNAEGDGLPGLVIDLYATTVAIQFHHPWVERYREVICAFALNSLGATIVVDRSQRAARAREGLNQSQDVMAGSYDEHPVIREHGVAYLVDVRNGQKTGFYLDQRANRALLARWANGRRVLDLYAHTGGFGLAALHAGARHVTFVESGSAAVDLLRENLSLNGIEAERWSVVRADVGEFLAAAPGSYDLVIMDPPPMARRKAHVANALRGMAGQLADAFRCAEPGALLLLFSCSHHLAQPELDALIASVAATAGRRIRVLQGMSADADHPSSAEHPEGRYLVGSLMHIEGPE